MIRTPFLRRWWRLGLSLAVALTLPVLTACYLNHRMKTLVADINSTGASATVEMRAPWFVSALSRTGLDYRLPMFFWKIPEVSFREGSRDGRPVTREEMERLVSAANRLGTVRKVCLWNPDEPLDPASLEPLQRLDSLVSLHVECGLHDDAAEALASIRQVRELRLTQPQLTAEGYASLAKLLHLEKLEILGPGPTSEDFTALARIHSLGTLVFETSHVEPAGLRHLAGLPRLERLALLDSIRTTEFSDGSFERDAVPALAAMPALKELRVGLNRGIPPERVAKLEAAKPGLKVTVIDLPATSVIPAW